MNQKQQATARKQLRAILDDRPEAAQILKNAFNKGQIYGSGYWSFALQCGCIYGTIGHALNIDRNLLPGMNLRGSDWDINLLERLILRVRPGQTPENSIVMRRVIGWIDEWMSEREAEQEAVR